MAEMKAAAPPADAITVKPHIQRRRAAWRRELETVLIGSVLMDRRAYAEVADILRPGTFIGDGAVVPNREVWAAIQAVAQQGPVDIITVTRHLLLGRMGNEKDEVSMIPWQVSRYTDRIGSIDNLRHHALCLFEFALREQAVAIVRQAGGGDLNEFAELAGYLADETRDIHVDIGLATGYLRSYGHTEATELMDELCGKVSDRLHQMAKQSWRQYIKEQYNIIIEQERTEGNGGN